MDVSTEALLWVSALFVAIWLVLRYIVVRQPDSLLAQVRSQWVGRLIPSIASPQISVRIGLINNNRKYAL